MYNNNTNNISGMNNMSQSLDHTESMLLTNGAVQQQQLCIDQQQQQLDSLSNLFINNWETEDAALEQYESEMDNTINDNLLNEKEQSNQRLFQSFQTSACAVAQMFKEKSAPSLSPTSSNANTTSFSWQSFQNSAGAITVLYKDSLEACKVHMDLGVCIGQQRKVKEIINWVKKKKKRTICKDELISFLIGKQYTNTSNQNQMFNLFSQNNSNANNGLVNTNLISKANSNNSLSSQQQQQATAFMAPNRRQQSMNRQQQTQLGRSNTNNSNSINNNNNNNNNNSNTASSSLLTNQVSSSLNPIGENSSGSNDSQAVETNSDLATFREALIMHNRSRDAPFNRSHHTNSHQNQHLNHLSHHHHHHHHHHPQQNLYHSQNSTNNTTGLSTNLIATNPSQQQQLTNMTSTGTSAPNCDDLDCFFCEQIATHIEHKRSAANSNFNLDMESPTRKRGRFC